MKINDLNKQQLSSLLNELYGLTGAKEVFKKFNIEMINEETEKQGLMNLLDGIKELLKSSTVVKEFNQAIQFLDMQIQTNEKMLETAEGFMKTMIEGMLASFKASKELAIKTQSNAFIKETESLLTNILNEEDKKKVYGYIANLSLDKVEETIKEISTLESEITNRYANDKVEEIKEEKKVAKEKKSDNEEHKVKKTKEEKKVEKSKSIEEEIDEMDMSELDDLVEETHVVKEEKKAEKVKEEHGDTDGNIGLEDFSDLEDDYIAKEIDAMDFSDMEEEQFDDNTEIDFM